MGGPRKTIQELEDVKMVGQNIKTMIRWRQHESSIFKDFFATIRFRPNKTLIFALKNENGIVVTKKEKTSKGLLQVLQQALSSLRGSTKERGVED